MSIEKNTIILFDLDGTLIDSTEAIIESFSVAFEHFGDEIPNDSLIKEQIGYPLEDMFVSLNISKNDTERYVNVYKQHYRKISRHKTTLLPGAKEAIELASTFAILGIVTTKTGIYSRELLEHMGIMDFFEILIGRENVVNPKPHPEPILSALEQLPKVSGKTWMIGDTCMDMDAASAAGIDSVAVLCGYGTQEKLQLCSHKISQNTLEAIKFITSM